MPLKFVDALGLQYVVPPLPRNRKPNILEEVERELLERLDQRVDFWTVTRSYHQVRQWLKRRQCYKSPAIQEIPGGGGTGVGVIRKGCIGITESLIGASLVDFTSRHYKECFEELEEAIAYKNGKQCKGNNTCGKPSKPVIFGFTYNHKACGTTYKVGPRGILIWGTLPCRKWIFDYGYYFEDAGIFIHALESEYMKKEDANGNIIKGPNGETYEGAFPFS